MKEDLKNVALGTSKINYMDPRITVAWCARFKYVYCRRIIRKPNYNALGKFEALLGVSNMLLLYFD